MKKSFKDLTTKSVQELSKEASTLREQITRDILSAVSSPQKDSNAVVKKRRQLARVFTAMNQKRDEENFKNTK